MVVICEITCAYLRCLSLINCLSASRGCNQIQGCPCGHLLCSSISTEHRLLRVPEHAHSSMLHS